MRMLLVMYGILLFTACQKKEAVKVPASIAKDSLVKKGNTVVPPVDTETGKPEIGVFVGVISGKKIAYDNYKFNGQVTEKFVVYIKNGTVKDTLFSLNEMDDFGDFYVSGAEMILLKGEPFIYVSSNHTYGNSKGYLFSVNINKAEAYNVEVLADTYKIPDSLYSGHVTYSELQKNENNSFGFSVNLYSPQHTAYIYRGNYKLLPKGNNQYLLKPYGTLLSDENGHIIKMK